MKVKIFRTDYTILVILILTVLIIYGVSWWYVDSSYTDCQDRGTFGDKFGAVNALFSGLAFAGLIFTIVLQRKELSLQREELKLTRKEMADQTAEFEKQNSTLQLQRFENTFFQMLSQFESVTDNLAFSYMEDHSAKEYFENGESPTFDVNQPRTIITGRELFRTAFEEVPHYTDYDGHFLPSRKVKLAGMRNLLVRKGMEGYMDSFTPSYFDHYFRLMYRILKFVDNTKLIAEAEKYGYTCILRALLSRYELVWLYYNGLSDYGSEKFKPLIEKYSMLQNLREELLVDECETTLNYSDRAYNHYGEQE